ncbi:Immune-associated nucleotide-binding protein 8 [Bulinus truncatus]|nr:Immune-associated nucleotide-binding protein 8 [Bulinus truncatus]
MMEKQKVNILLMGTAGNGKSSCGNSIVGGRIFETSADITSERCCVATHSIEVGEYLIHVLDLPGIDPDLSSEQTATTFQNDVQDALMYCHQSGFTALILVLKYGSRFTKQEKETIRLMKSTLGDDVIKNCVICVMTHGDCFEEEISGDFSAWCKEQEGAIKILFEECAHRCLLFDNKTKDQSKINHQVRDLLKLTKQVNSYTNTLYGSAHESRSKLQQEILAPRLLNESSNYIDDLKSQMLQLEVNHSKDNKRLIEGLEDLLNKLHQYQNDNESTHSQEEDENTLTPSKLVEFFRLELETKIKLKESEEKGPKQSKVRDSFKRYEEIRQPVKRQQKRSDVSKPLDFVFVENEIKQDIDDSKQIAAQIIQQSTTVNLLLIGTAGNGKSACGNTIIGHYVFPTSSMCSTDPNPIRKHTTQFEHVEINVIEMPGIDTDIASDDLLSTFDSDTIKVFEKFDYRLSALILVLKYGNRFTVLEKETVKFVERLFGNDVLCNHVICAFSFGDQFKEERNKTSETESFKEWCRAQENGLKTLLNKCQNRCVLFDNKSEDDSVRRTQVKQLLSLTYKTEEYTYKYYRRTLKKREQLTQVTVELKNIDFHLNNLMLDMLEHMFDENGFTSEKLSDFERKLHNIQKNQRSFPLNAHTKNIIDRLKKRIFELKADVDVIFFERNSLRATVSSTGSNANDTQSLLKHTHSINTRKLEGKQKKTRCICNIL